MPDHYFRWLTPGGTSALDLVWVSPPLFAQAFHEQLPEHAPSLVTLRDQNGQILELAVVARVNTGLVISCHGGPSTRAAISRALGAAGGSQEHVPDLWGETEQLATAALADLPLVRGDLGVQLLLATANSAPRIREAMNHLGNADRGRVATALKQARFLFAPPRVQLWGPVNAGKSSLLNALCGDQLAAVGPEAGLTRDVIEGTFEHGGFVVTVLDAPGVPQGNAGLDQAAYELAEQWRKSADLTLELVPPGSEPACPGPAMLVYSRADQDELRRTPAVSTQDPASVNALRQRIMDWFVGDLLALPESLRVALPLSWLDRLQGGNDLRELFR